MDADRPLVPNKGGTVEPANRAKVAREAFQMPHDAPRPRYELRDPFADVTYRVDSFKDMTTKADQLGATRFHAIAPDGTQTPVTKVDGEWKRPAQEASPSLDSSAINQSRSSKVVALPGASAAPSSTATLAKIDAEAERAARMAALDAALRERYVMKRAAIMVGTAPIGQTEYRFRGDTNRVAFTETTFKLATDSNNPSVARSMVDVAEARNWQGLRVSGSEDFKRMVWLEASLRGVKAMGYEPQLADQALLKREREARSVNRIEPTKTPDHTNPTGTPQDPGKPSARGSGGGKAVLAALEAVLLAQRVPGRQRDAVMAAAADNLARRLARGEVHKVKVFDRDAPAPRAPSPPQREVQRNQERSAPVR
jgi:hypothetical protein